MRSYLRRCASADVGGQKLTMFQLAQRCRAMSADAQQHEYERTFILCWAVGPPTIPLCMLQSHL